MHLAERFAQQPGRALGIDGELLGSLTEGGESLRAGAQRRLVGRQLDGLAARGTGLAGKIGRNVENAGLRRRSVGHGILSRWERGGPYAKRPGLQSLSS